MKAVLNAVISYIRRTDHVIWMMCFAMTCVSLFLLLGIIDSGYADTLEVSRRNVFVQGLSALIGTFGAVIISIIDYKDLARLWKFHVPLSYILVMLTFIFGVGAPGRPEAKRWLIVPVINLSLQPAEVLRISFILAFAYHLFKVQDKLNRPVILLSLLAHAAVPVLLSRFQGDDGTALIFVAIALIMLFCAGLNWKYVLGAFGAIAVSVPILWNYILSDFQKQRFLAVYNGAQADIQGVLYQQYWARIAFAKGGQFGIGVFSDSHTYVPEMHNDFIFSFLGESWGLVGCISIIIVMMVLWIKILICASKAKDKLGSLICIGVFSMLAFQAIINIGMNLSLLPVIGNTLPFLSSGGSSAMTSYFGIGLVISVYMHKVKYMFE